MDERTQVKVLIIEDQPEVRNTIRLGLRILRTYKFEFIEAANGKKGVQILANGFVPNLIIVDLMMPEMNGFEFIGRIKSNKKFLNVPIIVLSARSSGKDISKALQLGVTDFVIKPFEYSDLSRMERGIEIGLLLCKADSISTFEEKIRDQQNEWNLVLDLEVSRTFKLKTSDKILPLCSLLASYFPENRRNVLCMGINEMLLNAILHGNLELDSTIKSQKEGRKIYENKIKKRKGSSPYKDRNVNIHFTRNENFIQITICDEGNGFDLSNFQDFSESPESLFLPYGRGIVMTRFAFDEVNFNFPEKGGTEVKLIINR